MRKVWSTYKEYFALISVSVTVAFITTLILLYITQWLVGNDMAMLFLLTSFLMASIYIGSRYAAEEAEPGEMCVISARFIFLFSLFSLLVVLSLYMPPPIGFIYNLIIVSLFFLAVPILSELGISRGLEKLRELLAKHPISYIALNWLFFLGLFAVLSLAVKPALIVVTYILLLFVYLPLFSLTGFYLAHGTRGR